MLIATRPGLLLVRGDISRNPQPRPSLPPSDHTRARVYSPRDPIRGHTTACVPHFARASRGRAGSFGTRRQDCARPRDAARSMHGVRGEPCGVGVCVGGGGTPWAGKHLAPHAFIGKPFGIQGFRGTVLKLWKAPGWRDITRDISPSSWDTGLYMYDSCPHPPR